MAQLKELADKRGGLLYFKPERLRPKPDLNARDYTLPENIAHVDELAESIRETGVQKPLVIAQDRDGNIWIVDGECRWRACMKLLDEGLDSNLLIPCLEEPRGTSERDRLLNLITANSGKQFTTLEAGRVIKRAVAMGADYAEIAKLLGKSVSWVTQTLDFQSAPAEIHAAVKIGEISSTLAAEIVRNEGDRAAETVKTAVATAKAAGKKKATRQHLVRATAPSVKVKGDDLRVTIDGKSFLKPRRYWNDLANAILDESVKSEIKRAERPLETLGA